VIVATTSGDVHSLAFRKTAELLGPGRAQRLIDEFVAQAPCRRLTSPFDLQAFAASLARLGGLEETVGARLRRYATVIDQGR
jgi:hypothetical protein